MRFSFNIPYRNHITPYLNIHSILNMKYRRLTHTYSFIYRIIKYLQIVMFLFMCECLRLFSLNEYDCNLRI